MFSFSEMKKLQEEEKTLIALTSKFSDQLTRLKVEELALVSMLGKQEDHDDDDDEISIASVGSGTNHTYDHDFKEDLVKNEIEEIDLSVPDPFTQAFKEEMESDEDSEEDDDEVDDGDQLKSFLRELSQKQKNS